MYQYRTIMSQDGGGALGVVGAVLSNAVPCRMGIPRTTWERAVLCIGSDPPIPRPYTLHPTTHTIGFGLTIPPTDPEHRAEFGHDGPIHDHGIHGPSAATV